MKFFLKNWHLFTGILIISVYSFSSFQKWNDFDNSTCYQFTGDIAVYYAYLPSFLHNNDPKMENFTQPCSDLIRFEDGSKMPKFTFGMSVMYSPFFLVAELFNKDDHELSKFGITSTHSIFIRIGCILMGIIGLFFTMKTLSFYFDKAVVLITTLLLFFSTNLMHYTIVQGEFPHTHLFMLFSLVLFWSHMYWSSKKTLYFLLLSFALGLIALIRASEIIFALIPILWKVTSIKALKERIKYFIGNWKLVFVSSLVFIIPIGPYLLYLDYMTGDFLYYAYGQEKFFFLEPKIIDFLFSFRNGWFIYTPIMLFTLFGFFMKNERIADLKVSFLVLISLAIYIFSSWWCWWFGGSFGNRSMIQYYAILCFPLAVLIEFGIRSRFRMVSTAILAIFFIKLNLFYSQKYNGVQIHWDSMTYEAFVFTIKHPTFTIKDYEEFQKLLDPPNYSGAIKGIDR